MTSYTGGKKRIGKEIASKIVEYTQGFTAKGYCEPFCGMLGVYQHIPELINIQKLKYKAGDRNPYIIKLWKGIQKGWIPPDACTEQDFYKFKASDDDSLESIFTGFASSYHGVFRCIYNKHINVHRLKMNCMTIISNLKSTQFKCGTYDQYTNLSGYVIYCDPPYRGTTHAYHIGNTVNTIFDSNKFGDWCKLMSKRNIVFVSEYSEPCSGAKLIWSKGKENLYLI